MKGVIHFILCLTLSGVPGILTGCGDTSVQIAEPTAKLEASASCLGCHGNAVSTVTDDFIADEWKRSAHFTKNGAGCRDCHEPEPGHPNSCGSCHGGTPTTSSTRHDVTTNPDKALKCFKCHTSKTLSASHFYNVTTLDAAQSKYPASYVSTAYVGNCRACHNPHDPGSQIAVNREWAKSGHGNVNGVAWATEDFKENPSCIRCHTTTGFISFVTGNYADPFPSQSWATPGDGTREVLTCKACHTNYNFKNSVRKAGAFSAPYNKGKNPKMFPDVGASNLCNACHSGRESGESINAITDFTNVSFKNPHYLAAAGLMYAHIGFTTFTSANAVIGTSTYGKSLSPDASVPGGIAGGISSAHRKLGTTAINGDSHNPAVFTPGKFDADGPCVTCHLNVAGQPSRVTSHTLQIDANAFNQVCVNCHSSEGGVQLTGDNFRSIFLEPQSQGFQDALSLVKTLLLNQYNIKFSLASHPYFYDLTVDPSGETAVKDWTRGTKDQAFGRKMMGACFNFNLLSREPAAFVHARTYTRRLIYDTIDFLDDGKMNLSVGATAVAAAPSIYGKGASAYTDGTLTTLSPGTTESMIYLIGWSRSKGTWNALERP